eukprot:7259764-Pyramimonas_sp.AAC.1
MCLECDNSNTRVTIVSWLRAQIGPTGLLTNNAVLRYFERNRTDFIGGAQGLKEVQEVRLGSRRCRRCAPHLWLIHPHEIDQILARFSGSIDLSYASKSLHSGLTEKNSAICKMATQTLTAAY